MANITSATETRTYDTVLSAFTGKVMQAMPKEQTKEKNTLLGMLSKTTEAASGGYMYVNVSSLTTKTGEGPFTKAATLTPTDEDDVTRAIFRRAVNRVNVTIFEQDLIDNPSDKAFFRLVAHKLHMGRWRMEELENTQMWATTATSNGIHGLPIAAPDAPGSSGAYGGLNGATAGQTWWQNEADADGYTISTGIEGAMDSMDYDMHEHEGWDFAVTSKVVHRIIRQNMREYSSITDPGAQSGSKAADLGYSYLKYDGKDIIWDRTCPSTSATADHRMYFVKNDCFKYAYVPGYRYRLSKWKELPEQEGRTATLLCASQCVTYARRGLGTISDLDV